MKRIKDFIYKALSYYKHLSILKKLLLLPLSAVVFVFPFYIIVFFSLLSINSSINDINNDSMIVFELSSENLLILESISYQMNSAVNAGEIDWIDSCDKNAIDIKNNLQKHSSQNYSEELKSTKRAFDDYYATLKNVSKKMLLNNNSYSNIEKETKLLIKKYNTVYDNLKELKNKSKNDIKANLKSFYDEANFIFVKAGYIFMFIIAASVFIIYIIYSDIRKRIHKIVDDSKEIAQGDIDFHRRLKTESFDELGKIVESINRFIDTLHESHIELHNAKKELEVLHVTDKLTSVYNRVKIDEILESEIKKAKRYGSGFSIILIDIDHFKYINDNYGHLAGDAVLVEFASLIKQNIRDVDFLGRWGGEEFIVISAQTGEEGAFSIAKHLRSKIGEFEFNNIKKLTASFGIASSAVDDDINSIVERADQALYKAKNGGRDRICTYFNKCE